MSDVYEHNPGDHEDPVTGPTWLLGAIGAVLLGVILFGLTALYYNARAEANAEQVLERTPWDLQQYRREQNRRLAGEPRTETRFFEGEDREFTRIPIDDAMRLVVEEGR